MPERDPSKPQLNFPELVRDLIADLNIIGQVGLLDFVPAVNPVFIVGSRGLTITSQPPVFASAEIFSGRTVQPGALAVIADTGQVLAGTFDIICYMMFAACTVVGSMQLQHRNAANSATLAAWDFGLHDSRGSYNPTPLVFSLDFAVNERLRFINITDQTNVEAQISAVIMASRRVLT